MKKKTLFQKKPSDWLPSKELPEGHPTKVYRRDGKGKPGKVTGSTRRCQMEGCSGVRVMVRWPNGKITWPCAKGLKLRKDDHWQIV